MFKRFFKFTAVVFTVLFFNSCAAGFYDEKKTDSEPEYLFLMYLGGDNNLSSSLISDFNEYVTGLKNLLKNSEKTTITSLVLFDSISESTKLYEIKFPAGGKKDITEQCGFISKNVDSASEEIMTAYLKYAKTNYKPEKTFMTIGSHGLGILGLPQTASSESYGNFSEKKSYSQKPEISESFIQDFTSGNDLMSETVFAKCLANAGYADENKLDLLLLDLCVEGGIEVAYQFKDNVKYLLCSPANIPGSGFPYNTLAQQFTKGKDIKTLAQNAVKIFAEKNYLNSQSPSNDTLTFADLSKIGNTAEPVAKLADYLTANAATYSDYIKNYLFNNSYDKKYNLNYNSSGYFNMYDLGFFCQKLQEYAENLTTPDTTLSSLCQNVMDALENAIVSSWRTTGTSSSSENYYSSLNTTGKNYYGLSIAVNANQIRYTSVTFGNNTYTLKNRYLNPYNLSDFAFNTDTTWKNLLKTLYPAQFN